MSDKSLKQLLDEINEFSVPTYEEWKSVTEKSLKGAAFEKLLTKTYEGITLQPMYQKEAVENIPYLDALPGFFPFQRGTTAVRPQEQPWIINQEIAYTNPKEANEALRQALENGQTGINLLLNEATLQANGEEVSKHGIVIQDAADFTTVFENIQLERYPIFINSGHHLLSVLASFIACMKERKVFLGDVHGTIGTDPLASLVTTGSLPYTLHTVYDVLANVTGWAKHHAPKISTILVQGHPYHNGGGSVIEELAFTLGTAVEYVEQMLERGLTIDDVACRMTFSFSIGSNVFMEIAKFRAARMLWATVVKAFGGNDTSQKMHIHARTSHWNKTIYDPHVNILRGAIEAFAGAVGGVDSLHVAPFDELIDAPSEFSGRIARNTQIILQEEAHIGKVNDPAGGSWYVEALTDEVAKRAWHLFQEVERQGGMLQSLQANVPQQTVAETAKQRETNIKHRKDVLVGTNQYANPLEKTQENKQVVEQINWKDSQQTIAPLSPTQSTLMTEAIEAAQTGATIAEIDSALQVETNPVTITPIYQKRGAEPFEQLRLAMEKHVEKTGERLKVFLANVGPIGTYKARSDFASGFFEVGGFEILANNGFSTAEEAAEAALDSGASTIVIVGKDDTYPTAVPTILEKLASKSVSIYLAGKLSTEALHQYKQAGLEEVIHVKSNVYDILLELQKKKGVLEE